MKTILNFLLSIIYYLVFGLLLIVFHPLQLVAYHVFGSKAQQKMVHWLNAGLFYALYITGASFKIKNKAQINHKMPLIIISNHQSMFDIIQIIWLLRAHYPIFVSKIELAKGVPSISLNLRLSGAALIDRNDSRQAIPEISRMAKWALKQQYAATIFPEGTRSKIDQLKPFAVGGLAILMKQMTNAQILPVAINGNNRLNPKGFFPLVAFTKVNISIMPLIDSQNKKPEQICAEAEKVIKQELGFD